MLQSIKKMIGYKVRTRNREEIGIISDLFFDDDLWIARYIIVTTNDRFVFKNILIIPMNISSVNTHEITVALTLDEIKHSPEVDLDKTVTRQYEKELHDHYSLPYYWDHQRFYNTEPIPLTVSPESPRLQIEALKEQDKKTGNGTYDPYLRALKEVMGYDVVATDKKEGYIYDFLVDTHLWIVRYIVVDTHKLIPGKKVVISPKWITKVNWTGKEFFIDHTSHEIKNAPIFNIHRIVDRKCEKHIYHYYDNE